MPCGLQARFIATPLCPPPKRDNLIPGVGFGGDYSFHAPPAAPALQGVPRTAGLHGVLHRRGCSGDTGGSGYHQQDVRAVLTADTARYETEGLYSGVPKQGGGNFVNFRSKNTI